MSSVTIQTKILSTLLSSYSHRKMFNVKHNECVGFESKWKVKKVSANSGTQTTEFSVSERGSETVERNSQGAQTETAEKTHEEVEMSKLANWLNKIYPNVKEQIDKTNSSRAFQNYRPANTGVDSICKLVQSVAIKGADGDKTVPIVNCLDWNNSGKLLAVAYSFKHKTWCHHTGTVAIYSLTRGETLSESPTKRLSAESCVTTVKFHPSYGCILAAGTFTGHIYVWNTENDVDALICNLVAHEEYITQISWVDDMDSAKKACLASSSTDSLLKLWTFNVAYNSVKLKTIFKIKTPIFGKIDDTLEVPKPLIDKGNLGVVCFDFSPHVPDMFVVVLEGGLIARCSLLGVTKIKANSGDVPYYDPVYKYYELHRGEIVSIRFSLHAKNMFLTNATDGEIRIYLVHQTEPAQVIFLKSPLNEISYVLHEKKLLAACGQGGFLEVFQLQTGKPIELTFNVKIAKRNLTSMTVNGSKTNYVAVGNNNGEIQLWDVPWQNIEYRSRHLK